MQFDQLKRREFITLLGVAAAWPVAARAQQPAKVPLVGVLVSASPPYPFADAFWRGLHALGYSEGQNIKVEFRYTEGRSDRAEEFAEELVRLNVDVIVAHYAIGTAAAMAATRTIPIVMVHGAPLQLGAINSLARPGGNVTGLSAMDAEIGGKRVQLLRELIPNLSRIAVLATTATTSSFGPPFAEDLRLAATSVGVGFEPILIGGPSEFRTAFAEMGKANVQAVVLGVPKATPAEIVNKLNKEVNAALDDPKMKARLADLGGTVLPGTPADFGKLIADETEKWAKVIRAANIKPE